jgi:DNA-binding FadR family transcriptional regulator
MADTEQVPAAHTVEQATNPIVRTILAYLQEHRLQPGDRLPSERALAEKLGIGRNALREALATLATLRVVESRPNSGIYLRRVSTESSFETLVMLADMGTHPSPTQIVETMEVRAALELLGVRLACERAGEPDFERIAAVIARTEEVLREGGNIHEQDTAFHIALIEATHNGVLVRVLNSFYRLTAQRRRALFSNQAQGKVSAREHRKLLALIKARDVAGAQELISRHMERARSYWKEVLGAE